MLFMLIEMTRHVTMMLLSMLPLILPYVVETER